MVWAVRSAFKQAATLTQATLCLPLRRCVNPVCASNYLSFPRVAYQCCCMLTSCPSHPSWFPVRRRERLAEQSFAAPSNPCTINIRGILRACHPTILCICIIINRHLKYLSIPGEASCAKQAKPDVLPITIFPCTRPRATSIAPSPPCFPNARCPWMLCMPLLPTFLPAFCASYYF